MKHQALQKKTIDLISSFCDCIPSFSKDSLKTKINSLQNLKDTNGFKALARIIKSKIDLDYQKIL